MSANILLNLFNKLRKSNKMWDLLSILSFFRNLFKKFNNTGAQMLDSLLTWHCLIMAFWHENVKNLPLFLQCCDGHHYIMLPNLLTTSSINQKYCNRQEQSELGLYSFMFFTFHHI